MKVSTTGSDFKPVPEGTYVAICVRVIDLGTQVTTFQGSDKVQRKVLIAWEVPEETVATDDGDKPALIMKRYTASLHEKAALRKDLESWRGRRFTDEELRGFELENLLGAPCQIQVLHNETANGTYANVAAIIAMPRGMPKPQPYHDLVNFSLDVGEFEASVYDSFSDGLKATIGKSPEFKLATGQLRHEDVGRPRETFNADLDDEIPF